MSEQTAEFDHLPCYADGIQHEAHPWDFGSGETFWCEGSTDEGDCPDERRLRESIGRREAVTPRYTSDDATLVGPDGFTRLAPALAEAQHNALEMAREAYLAERRAEEAEFHVEQLRDARDQAERRIEAVETWLDEVTASGPPGPSGGFPAFRDHVRDLLGGPPAWPCDNYVEPSTCLTTGCTTPCDQCLRRSGNRTSPGQPKDGE